MKQTRRRIRQTGVIVCLALFLIFLNGCAVLTRTQVKEVETFAGAAQKYSTLPGSVAESYAGISRDRQLLDASTLKEGELALESIEEALSSLEKLKKQAAEVDRILHLLNVYGELLLKLTSGKFTEDVHKHTKALGSEIDGGIKYYNEHYNKSFDIFGGAAAAVVRGAAGLFIKRKQSKALKKAVTGADPLIRAMIVEVEKFLLLYLDEKDLDDLKLTMKDSSEVVTMGWIGKAGSQLKGTYKNVVKKYREKDLPVPFETVLNFAHRLQAVRDTIRLAKDTLRAGRAYCNAHAKLAESVKSKTSFKTAIAQIRTLTEEISAARKLAKELK